MESRKKLRCSACKRRHVKCVYDSSDDACTRCRSLGTACAIQHRFRHIEHPAVPTDHSIPSPDYHKPDKVDASAHKSLADALVQQRAEIKQAAEKGAEFVQGGATLFSTKSHLFEFDNTSPINSSTEFFIESPSSISTPSLLMRWENGKEQAILLRHFVLHVSKLLDVCDNDEHFRRIVPIKAMTCTTLMKAVCALSSWHMCRLGKFDQNRSDFLYQDCLDHLIKLVDSPSIRTDDSALVATVMLHVLEELREQSLRINSRGHMVGILVFIDPSQPNTDLDNGLRRAAFRLAARSELHMAFVNQDVMTLPAELCKIDRDLGESDDETWAMRMILHCRDALSYSLTGSMTTDTWTRLVTYHKQWDILKPISFSCTMYEPADRQRGRVFPQMWFLLDSHGTIHYHLCRIILASSNPRLPRLGREGAELAASVDVSNKLHTLLHGLKNQLQEEIKDSVVFICGIALSNDTLPSTMIAASMVIVMCAERFLEVDIQLALHKILIKTRELYAWPTEAGQDYVRSLWHMGSDIIGSNLPIGFT